MNHYKLLTIAVIALSSEALSEPCTGNSSSVPLSSGESINIKFEDLYTNLIFSTLSGPDFDRYFAVSYYDETVIVNLNRTVRVVWRDVVYVMGVPVEVIFANEYCIQDSDNFWPPVGYERIVPSNIPESIIHPFRNIRTSVESDTRLQLRGYYVKETNRLWTEELSFHNNSLRPMVLEDYFMVYGRPSVARMDIADFKRNTIVMPGESYSFNLTFEPFNESLSGTEEFHLAFTVNDQTFSPWMFPVALNIYETEAEVPAVIQLPAPRQPYSPPRPPGDLNNDGVVDVADYIHGGSREL